MKIRNFNLGAWIINKGYSYSIENGKLDIDISKTEFNHLNAEYETTDHKACHELLIRINRLVQNSRERVTKN